MLLARVLFTLLVIIISFDLYAQTDRVEITPSTHQIEYLSQTEREYFFNYVTKLGNDKWQTINQELPLRLSSHSYWLRLTVTKPTSDLQQWFLEVSNPLIDKLDIYVAHGDSFESYQVGDTVPASSRPTPTRVFLIPMPDDQQPHMIYIKYQGSAIAALPMALISNNQALKRSTSLAFGFGLFIGLIILVFLASSCAYFIARNKAYLFLSGYCVSVSLMLTILEGYASLVLWPSFPWLQNLISPTLSLFIMWLLVHFTSEFLEFNKNLNPSTYKVYNVFTKTLVTLSAVLLVLPISISATASLTLLVLSLMMLAYLVWSMHRQGHRVDRWYLASAVIFSLFLAIKISSLVSANLLTTLSSLSIFIFSLHLLTMTLALIRVGYDQYILHRDGYIVMIELAEHTAKLDRNILEEHQEEHQTLEALVDERTFELNVTLRELQETNRRLEEQSTNDALTGAKNRKFFDQRVQAEYRLSRRQQTPVSLLMLDIDFFKKINDTYGHLAGDKVLVSFTHSIKALLRRPNDYVCRYGGEEFAVLLSNTDQKGALKVAELIRDKIEQQIISVCETSVSVTVSIGVSTLIIGDSTSDDELFSLADKALYQAKELGRNRVCGNLPLQI